MPSTAWQQGWLAKALHLPSPHFDERPENTPIDLVVVHNISLPAGQFGLPFIKDLFLGKLDCSAHESFSDLKGLRVSSHFLIDRQGSVSQFVPINKRAWHAGRSCFEGRENCNDFSVGIELEGTDTKAYTGEQYHSLAKLVKALEPTLANHYQLAGHCDIAPGRKTDPGESFDWPYLYQLLSTLNGNNLN